MKAQEIQNVLKENSDLIETSESYLAGGVSHFFFDLLVSSQTAIWTLWRPFYDASLMQL